MTPSRPAIALLTALACSVLVGRASAQEFPTHTVHIVLPFPPGGSADLIARLLADRLSRDWGHAVVVENRAGINGGLGAEAVAKSPPDGHTILFGTSPVFTVNKLLFKDLAYDPERDFKLVSLIAATPNVLGVTAKLPAANLKELIAYARANPGKLSFASQGNGSTGHLTGTMFMQMARIDIKHVPYRGSGPAWNDVVAGHVYMLWDGIPAAIGLIEGGKVRALAVGSKERSPKLPDVPTAIESGLAGFESESWFATAVGADTPDPLVRKLSQSIMRAVRSPEVSARIVSMGARAIGSTPEELAAYAKATNTLWKRVIDTAHIRIE